MCDYICTTTEGKVRRDFTALLLPGLVLLGVLAVWAIVPRIKLHGHPLVEDYELPSPLAVLQGIPEEVHTGRLFSDIVASLFRVGAGFSLAVVFGIMPKISGRTSFPAPWSSMKS